MKKLIDSQQYRRALEFFDRQLSICNNMTFNLALKACSKLNDYQYGIRIHQQLSVKALNDKFIQTSLIHFYMQCHDIDQAQKIFSSVKNKTVHMYGAMFKGYISNNMPEKVIELFETISVEVDEVLIIILFNACAKLCNSQAIKLGRDTLNRLPISFLRNPTLVNSAIDMSMKFGDVNQAENLFEKIQKKTLVTYGAMMQGYVKNNLFESALHLFEKNTLKSDEVLYGIAFKACASLSNEEAIQLGKKTFHEMPKVYLNHTILVTSAIHMFMKFGEIEIAEYLFSQIKQHSSYTYGVMINGYKINHEPQKCLSLFERMKKENITIDESISLSLIGACSQIGIRSICQNIVHQIPLSQSNIYLNTALIDMWGKSGDINQAKQIFQSISQPGLVTYTSMMNAYARNGMGYEAIDLYNKIHENIRDRVSHICVLNACSHSGLIDQAQMIFNKIDKTSVEIVTAMIDCLSRMGMFDQAENLVEDYEKSNLPNLIMYTAMLSAARNYRLVALSEKLYNRMRLLFPDENFHLISASILLSNIYSSLGYNQEVKEIRIERIKQFGKNITVGVAWTEVNGQLVRFQAHDRSHPQSDEIYAELVRLSNELKEHGHEYDSSWITRPLKNEETIESVLCGHSEKLAIAFNFIQYPRPSFIQITKNLRVCGDCHRATKLIAKIRQCEIIVRDANRIHHFYTSGQCSCQDHF
ncbi:unnamed protein product [Rotaria magnacalcarata]|uniref:DYW domain-containing protein n=3 Tax=Rotaria magnacalcarata TaxID=392030 RepID=A0A816BIV5_9BILA|nr:unnamed protein product [Rotaria magnacalcarata]CAF4099350.1 unnamed protein product [Rotaria magnacalcarata]CAF4140988.1 unnamed protein product [Rotaria magnacalcarata]